jgi:SAM-dependent methyltransferase
MNGFDFGHNFVLVVTASIILEADAEAKFPWYRKPMNQKRTTWGKVAGWYDELLEGSADSFQAKVIAPNLTRIAGKVRGLTVLDVGCGQGFFSRIFQESGAKVLGCDISSELIDIAKENSPKDIQYSVCSSDDLSFVTPGSVDLAFIVLAIQNINKFAETFAEIASKLKTGGRLILVMNHPAFRIPKKSDWQWDEQGNQWRRIASYMSDIENKIDMTPGDPNPVKKVFTYSFHRPIQSYFKALNKSGLAVTRLEEWISHRKSQDGPRGPEEDRSRKEIPMFMCIEAKKF